MPQSSNRLLRQQVWAFTLIEVLFASSILAGLSYFVLSAFFEGRRQALGTASTLSELLLARGVLEQLADQVEADPTALGRLTGYGAFWSQWSYVVRPSEPVSAPDGTPIDRPSPFLGFLAEGDPEAPAEPSADASASATAPQRDRPGAAAGGNSANRAYADLVMQLELRHSDWKPSGLSAGDSSEPLPREMVTEVTVRLYRLSARRQGKDWSPSLTVTTALLTPVESMSAEAAREFAERFKKYDPKPARDELLERWKVKPGFAAIWKPGFDQASREILADLFLLYREVNLEQSLTLGRAQSSPPGGAATTDPQGLSGLISRTSRRLEAAPTPRVRQELTGLQIRLAQCLLDSFKRARGTLSDLKEKHEEFLATVHSTRDSFDHDVAEPFRVLEQEVEALPAGLATGLASAVQGRRDAARARLETELAGLGNRLVAFRRLREQYGSALEASVLLLGQARLFEWFVTDARFVAVFQAMQRYPDRFGGSVLAAERLAREQKRPLATALQSLFAIQDWIELAKARRLLDPAAPETDTAGLAAAARQEAGFPALGDYVEATQVELAGPLPALQEFYRNFVETLADLKPLAEKEGVVAQILSQYVPEPPGSAKERTVTGYLDAVGSLAPHMIRTGLGLACLRRALELPQVRQRLASLELELPDEVEKATEQELLRQVVASTRPAFEHGFCELAQLATGAPSSQQARRREGSQAQSRGGAQAWLAGAATAVRLVGDAATGRSSPARGRGQVGGGRLGRDGHSDGTPGANLGDAEENGGR